jgi:hypothetical protein
VALVSPQSAAHPNACQLWATSLVHVQHACTSEPSLSTCHCPQPQNVLAGALYWLRLLRALSAERLEELRGSPNPSHNAKAEALAASGKAKYAKDHVDRYGDTAWGGQGGG